MGDWPLHHGGGRIETFGVSSERGVQLTSNASANTKGTAAQLVAATTREAHGVILQLHTGASQTFYLVDLLIGSATEEVLIPNLAYYRGAQDSGGHFHLPIRVPAGSRLAARCQDDVGSGQVRASGLLLPPNPRFPAPFGRVTAYGVNTATSQATLVPGNASSTYTHGTITEITSGTDRPHSGLMVAVQAATTSATATGVEYALDLLIGSSTEEPLVENITFVRPAGVRQPVPICTPTYPVSIPAGTRIAARLAAGTTTADLRDIRVAVYGVS